MIEHKIISQTSVEEDIGKKPKKAVQAEIEDISETIKVELREKKVEEKEIRHDLKKAISVSKEDAETLEVDVKKPVETEINKPEIKRGLSVEVGNIERKDVETELKQSIVEDESLDNDSSRPKLMKGILSQKEDAEIVEITSSTPIETELPKRKQSKGLLAQKSVTEEKVFDGADTVRKMSIQKVIQEDAQKGIRDGTEMDEGVEDLLKRAKHQRSLVDTESEGIIVYSTKKRMAGIKINKLLTIQSDLHT